ncbi:MAG: TonB-dependent receptor plug domain-containing protein [Bdellovibrionota bacterium]
MPLIDVSVFLLPDGEQAVTGENAIAFFSELACTEHTWVVNITGYKRVDIKKQVSADETFTVYVEKIETAVFETKVSDNRLQRDGSKRVLQQDEFIKAVGSRGDPVIALENMPGFDGFSDQGGGVILQGADPEDTRLYVNGHEVPLIFHSLGFSSIFIPDVIDSVDLLTAGFGAEYGRTTAGNINLTTASAKKDRLHAMAYVDLLNSAAVIQGPLDEEKKHSFWLGGRVSYIGPVFNLVTQEDDNISFNQVPQFYDLEGSYQWEMNDRWTFDLLGFGAKDQLKLRIKDSEDPLFRGDVAFATSFFRLIPRLRYDDGDQNRFEISTAHGIDYLDQAFGDFFFDATLYAPSLRSEFEHRFSDQFAWIVGIDTMYTHFKADLRVPSGTFPNSVDQSVPPGLRDIIAKQIDVKYLDLGFYTRINAQDAKKRWLLSPNLRFDYAQLTDQAHLSPRIEITRTLSPVWKVRGATGLYYQTPQAPEVEQSFGNPDLEDVRSIHYALSAMVDTRKNSNHGFWGDVTVFYKSLDHVVIDTNDYVTRDGELVPERYSNDGKGYAVGSQWAMQFHTNRLTAGLAYTLLWSRRKEPGVGYQATDFERRHNFNLRARYQLGRWELSSRLRLISGAPDTPIVNAYYDLDNDVYYPVEGENNSQRLPIFMQWDVRVDRKWIYNKWILSLYVDILNVTNRTNGNQYEYEFDYSDRTIQGGIPILPTFGVKGEF